jgi:hypothetical protein
MIGLPRPLPVEEAPARLGTGTPVLVKLFRFKFQNLIITLALFLH